MDHFAHLWLFFLMVLGIIILPGMDMAFVMASSLTGGRRAGLFAVAGIVAGGICHVVAGALGLGILLQLVPGMVNVMLVAGSLYIAWIGWSLMRSTSVFGALPDIEPPSPWRTFRQAALTCLLNPKAYLFMLAIFPQFLRLEYGSLWVQAVALGLIIAITQSGVYGSLALAAAGTRRWLAQRPGASVAMARAVGA
ncbi:LysE family translocator, partial [Polaromonas sp. P5_E6]